MAIGLLLGLQTYAQSPEPFRFRLIANPNSLDWSQRRASYEMIAIVNLMEGLVDVDAGFTPRPALAEKWTESADKKTYTFHLRKDAKWSDGVAVRAQDFVFAWRRLLDPKTKSEIAPYLFDIEGAREFAAGKGNPANLGIQAIDPSTLEVRLSHPSATFLPSLYHAATFPMREDKVRQNPADWWKPGKLVVTGAYVLKSWTPGKTIEFSANPLYFGSRPSISEVRAVIEPNAEKARELVLKNEIDLLFAITTGDIVRYTTGNWQVRQFDALNTALLRFTSPKLSIELRRAIAMAIDRSKVSAVLESGKVPADSIIPRAMFGYENSALPFNPTQARNALIAGGFKSPATYPRLRLLYSKSIHDAIANFVHDSVLSNLGLTIETIGVEPTQFESTLKTGRYDLVIETWWADFPDPVKFLSRIQNTNFTIREALVAAETAKSPIERQSHLTQIQKTALQEQALMVPLYHSKTTALLSARVGAFDINPLTSHLYFKQIRWR